MTSVYESVSAEYPSLMNITSIYNASCVIPEEVYDTATSSFYDMFIYEYGYNKDGLEIPVFQYSCQIDSVNNIEISSNILKGIQLEENEFYIYRYKVVENTYLNEENAMLYLSEDDKNVTYNGVYIEITNNVEIAYRGNPNNDLLLTFYGTADRVINDTTNEYTTAIPDQQVNALGKTILIYRQKISKVEMITFTDFIVSTNEFVMAINKCTQSGNTGSITIPISSYKLK